MNVSESMTTRAREVLADCEHALADFEASWNTQQFGRPRWVALITLLRTVGLVLYAVDRMAAEPPHRQRIDDAWARLNATKPEPRIFHDFIDAERASVVHLYEPSAGLNVTIRPASNLFRLPTGELGSTTFDFVMRKGPFEGQNPLQLARDAIRFWREYLNDIERKDC
jgi:hypothetical protein